MAADHFASTARKYVVAHFNRNHQAREFINLIESIPSSPQITLIGADLKSGWFAWPS
jgi:hypothetical protein